MRPSAEGGRGGRGDAGGSRQPGAGDSGHDAAASQSGSDHPAQEEGQLRSARKGRALIKERVKIDNKRKTDFFFYF